MAYVINYKGIEIDLIDAVDESDAIEQALAKLSTIYIAED